MTDLEPIYDKDKAIAQLDGDVALFAEISAIFVSECGGYCAALESALRSGDTSDLRREAHTLKSMLASFACEAGRSLALTLEQHAASGKVDGAGDLVAELISTAKRLAGELGRNAT